MNQIKSNLLDPAVEMKMVLREVDFVQSSGSFNGYVNGALKGRKQKCSDPLSSLVFSVRSDLLLEFGCNARRNYSKGKEGCMVIY